MLFFEKARAGDIIVFMKKAAILYDFDKTLCAKDMQEYSLIPSLGYTNPRDFWDEVTEIANRNRMDGISAYLFVLREKFEEQNHPLTRKMFREIGSSIELYNGVETWFRRINEHARKAGLYLEHYIISSGMAEIIESTSIAEQFARIYACRYHYDESGKAVWPAQIVNYTTKTQYIFRINKQVLDENDDYSLNVYMPHKDRPVPFERMIYIADGLTDVPCMRLVKEYGGKSIAVYNKDSQRAFGIAKQLLEEGRANYMMPADYEKGSDMENLIMMIIDEMGIAAKLEEIEKNSRRKAGI